MPLPLFLRLSWEREWPDFNTSLVEQRSRVVGSQPEHL
jgi:hypothetical protein